jgi:O-antigen ligase
MPSLVNHQWQNRIFFILYLAMLVSMIFSFRAISSIGIGLLILTGLLLQPYQLKQLIQRRPRLLLLIAALLFFLLQLLAILYSADPKAEWSNIQLKTAILLAPLSVFLPAFLNPETRNTLLKWFCVSLLLAFFYCLLRNFFLYQQSSEPQVFFYHKLVAPVRQHAVYVSLYTLTGLIFLFENLKTKDFVFSRIFHYCSIALLSIFLLLLSSKFVLVFYILYILYYLFVSAGKSKASQKKVWTVAALLLFVLVFVFSTQNPVSRRFKEIAGTDLSLVTKEKYSDADYFNGIQFRLLQWRLVTEILTEEKAWLQGVGAGYSQTLLDKKYSEKGMYTGSPERKDRGYLGYNTHNQFLQSLLQNGLPGLLLFVALCYFLVRLARQQKNRLAGWVTALVLLYSLSESVSETQYGILLFLFLPLFLIQED